MPDVSRHAFAVLITKIEELEELVHTAQMSLNTVDRDASDSPDGTAATERLAELQELLHRTQDELARLSDGCGHGHHTHS